MIDMKEKKEENEQKSNNFHVHPSTRERHGSDMDGHGKGLEIGRWNGGVIGEQRLREGETWGGRDYSRCRRSESRKSEIRSLRGDRKKGEPEKRLRGLENKRVSRNSIVQQRRSCRRK